MAEHTYSIVNGQEVESEKLDHLMRCYFSAAKSDFLREYGDWRHRGNEHRYVVMRDDGEIVGYFASIPVEVLLQGRPLPALWWMDLFVLPGYRGKGIQRLTDQAARQMAELHMGFPNHLAAIVHRKHGWGIRSDYRVVMLPLRPSQLPQMQQAGGRKRYAMRVAAWAFEPATRLHQRWLASHELTTARLVANPSAEFLANIFQRQDQNIFTTNRTSDYLRWRYLEAPYRGQMSFFTSGDEQDPVLAAVTRTFIRHGVKIARILDIFGNLSDHVALSALLKRIIGEMVKQKAVYITAVVTYPKLLRVFRRNGFLLNTSVRFRWLSPDPEVMRIIGEVPGYWCFGDSDNDSID